MPSDVLPGVSYVKGLAFVRSTVVCTFARAGQHQFVLWEKTVGVAVLFRQHWLLLPYHRMD
jgi:hypothetical protein